MTDALSGRRIEPPNTTGTVAAELLARSLTGTIKLTQTIIGRYYYINVMTTTSNSNWYFLSPTFLAGSDLCIEPEY